MSLDLARELIDARANQLTPAIFSERIEQIAAQIGAHVRIRDAAWLREHRMGGLLAIGSGSTQPARLAELWWGPRQAPAEGSLALVGKGVTFDSGGLSLKDSTAMVGMHTDMAGAATVLGAMADVAATGEPPLPVHAVLPIAENLPGPTAVRPGDVVETHGGVRVEVVDTDFEGRVMMADALAYASGQRPRAIIDIATLTHQSIVALGPRIGAIIGREPALRAEVEAAGREAGESWWPLPWAPQYRDQLRSCAPGASLRNHPGTDTARALTAALFLGEFVPAHIPWTHLDIAGPAVEGSGADARATGFGVATLARLLRRLAER
ncbi:M17 family metallopeptidase [uncultured Aeromicrobium sp.]|uniref:M17 family metallopeptidase n=1 Tax=uncultured Aeromicrobium sp. TaxID=337820 RepID=UPI0025D63661|nr:M17 family metallopeptidase [uncultured Aeromicrobium sp.]